VLSEEFNPQNIRCIPWVVKVGTNPRKADKEAIFEKKY
jgi:hypothetical protein